MKFGQAILSLFAVANSVNGRLHGGTEDRALATSMTDSFHVKGYQESLGECRGAICGLWGDPHILTCDGLGFDCNAQGIFTLMKNSLYTIQANFIHVNSIEMGKVLGWGNHPRATYTNDIMIQNVRESGVPVMQFTFPHFHNEEDVIPSERGCLVRFQYNPELSGEGKTFEDDITKCRERCEGIDGCTKFVFKHDGRCQVYGEDAVLEKIPSNWSRRVAGPVEKCGHPDFHEAIADNSEQRAKAKVIANGTGNKGGHHHGEGCPVNFYLDGELMDISQVDDDGYLYGDANSDVFARFDGHNQIHIQHKTDSEAISEIMLETAGDGPGELFSCHWNMFVCLPQQEEDDFSAHGLGLLGSPDNNSHNDWMNTDGVVIPLPYEKKGKAAYEYCRDNWCVKQKDSLMTYPEGTDYNDHKCHYEEYVDPKENCMVEEAYVKEHCDKKHFSLRPACVIDCCALGCATQDEEHIGDVKTLSDDPDDCIHDDYVPPICDESNNFLATGESVCPSTSGGSVVKLIDSTTSADIPDGQPIIYGLHFNPAMDDELGPSVTFRVDNPFGSTADAYVRYSEQVGRYAKDPACKALPALQPGCDVESQEITVGCIEYPELDAFALVDIYFASTDGFVTSNSDGSTEINKCCEPPDYDGSIGIIKYTFKIQCACPTVA